MRLSSFKRAVLAALIPLAAGCAGGGCGGCAGVTPVANPLPANKRVDNAVSLGLTPSGLGFVQSNFAALAAQLTQMPSLSFPIPPTSFAGITVCPAGTAAPACTVEINMSALQLTSLSAGSPYELLAKGTLPIRIQDLVIDAGVFGTGHAALNASLADTCPGGGFDNTLPIDVDISFKADQNGTHIQVGFTAAKVEKLFNTGDVTTNLQSHFHFCPTGSAAFDAFLNGAKDVAIAALIGQLDTGFRDQVNAQLCRKPNPAVSPACPTGSLETTDGICRYTQNPNNTSAACVATPLGSDGKLDAGSLLATLSPGTRASVDFLTMMGGASPRTDGSGFAWGDLNPAAGHVSIGMMGGVEPSPVSKCVKQINVAVPANIPIPDQITGLAAPPPNTPPYHLGLALSERFTNYALTSAYNSGVLCIGLSPDALPSTFGDFLSTGTFGLIAASVRTLGLQQEPQQIAIVVRPGAPPSASFGDGTDIDTDPHVRVKMDQAAFDFYIFSRDRFIRFMTATFDLDVPVNLQIGPSGLTPEITKIGVNNPVVTNNSLLREKADQVATSLAGLLSGLVAQQIGNALTPIDLNSLLASLGLTLDISRLGKLAQGNDSYLGVFASLGVAPPVPAPPAPFKASQTSVKVASKSVAREGVHLATARPENLPSVTIDVMSNLADAEYSVRVDKGPWRPFVRGSTIDVRDEQLRFQGKHVIAVRSRAAGVPRSTDVTPAEVEVMIDPEAPAIAVDPRIKDGKVSLQARDLVSDDDHTMVRYKLDQGSFGDWAPASVRKVVEAGEASSITIEARDPEGNVATATQALIRGRETATSAGCGCVAAGREGPTAPWAFVLMGAAIAGALARRSRRRSLVACAALAAASSAWAGCNCNGETNVTSSSTSSSSSSSSGDAGPACPTCIVLTPGFIGEYTSAAVASDGTVWVSGYAESNAEIGFSWGDLAAGKWDGTKVVWELPDGVPTDPPVDPKVFDVTSFRGGQIESGDDVGLWTSMALDGQDHPVIAYYDRTHKALKVARYDGTAWSNHVVEQKDGADVGRYAKIVSTASGFAIAYQSVEPGGNGGKLLSKVRVATSASMAPSATKDWTFEDVASDADTPCIATLCPMDQRCFADTRQCTVPSTNCSAACASGQACRNGACRATLGVGKVLSYPDAIGDYIALAKDSSNNLGIAYYDRIHGDLVLAYRANGAWQNDVVAGATGDTGIGTSLFIDAAGDYHLTFVDGVNEGLVYLPVSKNKVVGATEVIDDGFGVGGTSFMDGQHIVGDDSNVMVVNGEIHVSYQDATSGKLRHARGTLVNGNHVWTLKEVSSEGFGGAFSRLLNVKGQVQIAHWWFQALPENKGDVVIVPAP